MGTRFWTVVGYDHNGQGVASKKFWSINAAQDWALEELEEDPNRYAEMFIMECSQTVMSIKPKEQDKTFIHTGPEYVHKSRISDDGERLQISHSKN